MPFYESVHCGVLRISLNEQFIWKWLAENNKISSINVSLFTLLVEDALHTHDWEKYPLDLNILISKTYKKHADEKKE